MPTVRRVHELSAVALHLFLAVFVSVILYFLPGRNPLLLATAYGVAFAQAGLLAIWSSLSCSVWYKRCLGAIIGFLTIGLVLGMGDFGWDPLFHVLYVMQVTGVGILVTCSLSVVRCCGVRISSADRTRSKSTGFQFGLRDMLLLFVLVACVIVACQLVVAQLTLDDIKSLFRANARDWMLGTLHLYPLTLCGWTGFVPNRPLVTSLVGVVFSTAIGLGVAATLPGFQFLWCVTSLSAETLVFVFAWSVSQRMGLALTRQQWERGHCGVSI